LDQWLVANRVRELGAGWIVAANRPQSLSEIVEQAIGLEGTERAREFADNHSGFDAQRALFEATGAIESAIAA
jgi:UDP:flavonoid glycosyltransferase YjiC (YdhE family)